MAKQKKNIQQQVEEYLRERYDFRYNTIANRIETKGKKETEWQEANENNLWRELSNLGYNYAITRIISLLKSDFVPQFNPFKEYFEHLEPWQDGIDHIQELCDYVKVQPITDQDRFVRMFTKWLVRAIRCALGGKMNKQVIMFVGGQNAGKTSFFRFLLPEPLKEYYKENIDPSNKDHRIAAAQKLIINFDEVDSMGRVDIAALKSFISMEKVDDRLPYDRKPSSLPRVCSFVGSTNKTEFLYDETGNVRWICFTLDRIVFDKTDPTKPNYNKIDMNKVWAQAYALYKDKTFVCDLTDAEIKANEEVNQLFLVRTEEMEVVSATMHRPTEGEPSEFLSAYEIKERLAVQGYPKLNHQKIGRALTTYKYNGHKARTDKKPYPYWGYDVVFNNTLI